MRHFLILCFFIFGYVFEEISNASPVISHQKYTVNILKAFDKQCIKPLNHTEMLKSALSNSWVEVKPKSSRWESEDQNLKSKSLENFVRIFSKSKLHLIIRNTNLLEFEHKETNGSPISIDCEIFDIDSKIQLDTISLNKFFESKKAMAVPLPHSSKAKFENLKGSSISAWKLTLGNRSIGIFAEHITERFMSEVLIKSGVYPRTGLRLGYIE